MFSDFSSFSVDYSSAPEPILKLLKDPLVNHEIKEVCFRLLEHPIIETLMANTPVSAIFEVCEEYKKHPELYDEIFYGKIRMISKEEFNLNKKIQSETIINTNSINSYATLKTLFEPTSLPKQIAEKFAECGNNLSQIKRLSLKIKCERLISAAFNHEQKIIALLVDSIDDNKNFAELINKVVNSPNKRIDFVRV